MSSPRFFDHDPVQISPPWTSVSQEGEPTIEITPAKPPLDVLTSESGNIEDIEEASAFSPPIISYEEVLEPQEPVANGAARLDIDNTVATDYSPSSSETKPRKSSMFARGVKGDDTFVMSFVTKLVYLASFSLIGGALYLLWIALPLVVDYSKRSLDYVGFPMSSHYCAPEDLRERHVGDHALYDAQAVLLGNSSKAFKRAFVLGKFVESHGILVRVFPFSHGLVSVARAKNGSSSIGFINAQFHEEVHFCDAINHLNAVKEEGWFHVDPKGIVSGPVREGVWFQVSPQSGKTKNVQISKK